jgi:CubicO group peptidase (beta-lactamase class C family)
MTVILRSCSLPRSSGRRYEKTLVLVAALVASLFITAAASADTIDSAIAHGWAGTGCASSSSLSQLVDSAVAASPDAISFQAAVFSPQCGFFQHTAGLRDVATSANADPSTRYGIASISKTLTASAVWTLIERHQLGFDETIDHWFSPSELFGVHQITVGDLLIGNTPYQSYDNTPQWGTQFLPTQQLSEQQVLQFLDTYGPVPLSGKLLDPLNGDYYILAVLLERVMHKPYDQVMTNLVFNPLGMQDSDVKEGLTPADGQHATLYSGGVATNWNGSQALASAAVESTATDMARFVYWNFVQPRILDDSTLATIFGPGPLTQAYLAQPSFGLFDSNRLTDPTVLATSFALPSWGPGFAVINDFDGNGRLLLGFYGNYLGESAGMWWDPATNEILTVASNSDSAIFADAALMHSLLQATTE